MRVKACSPGAPAVAADSVDPVPVRGVRWISSCPTTRSCSARRRPVSSRRVCPLPVVRRLADEPSAHDPAVTRDAGELGWFVLFVPEEFGGGSVSGSPLQDAVIIAEERGRFVQPGPFVATNVAAFAIVARAPATSRRRTSRAWRAWSSPRRGRSATAAGFPCRARRAPPRATAGTCSTAPPGSFPRVPPRACSWWPRPPPRARA